MYTPAMVCDNPNVSVDFWSDYNNYSGYDTATFKIWVASPEPEEFFDDFEGAFGLWVVNDNGSGNLNVEDSSLGGIKAMFQ